MSLKDIIAADVDMLIAEDEFAKYHDIDGEKILCVVDGDEFKSRSNREHGQYEGIYKDHKVVFIKEADLGYRPVFGQDITLDGVIYLVTECRADCGMLEISLDANCS